jgi:hypothetical protein
MKSEASLAELHLRLKDRQIRELQRQLESSRRRQVDPNTPPGDGYVILTNFTPEEFQRLRTVADSLGKAMAQVVHEATVECVGHLYKAGLYTTGLRGERDGRDL